MSDQSQVLTFKIGIIGPSRVGKTSLLTSVLEASQKLLEGKPVSMKLGDAPTRNRIQRYREERNGFLFAGEFNPGGLGGTQEKFIFQLNLESGAAKISLEFMDYPGGWIDPLTRTDENEKRWHEECVPWLEQSHVLLIPVDAAVIMEAKANRHKQNVPRLLKLVEVEDITREWAKNRVHNADNEHATIMFLPVKCESYFADNYGLVDKSEQLYTNVQYYYHKAIEAARGEFQKKSNLLSILYSPIDTYGCVEIIDVHWEEREAANLDFEAIYRLRDPKTISPKGADSILVTLCKLFLEISEDRQKEITNTAQNKANSTKEWAERDEGFFRNLGLWASGKRKERKIQAKHAENIANAEKEKLSSLSMLFETIYELSKKSEGSRIRLL